MGNADYYKHGDRNAICDSCGFKFKLSQLRKRWDGLMVDPKCWEPEHPQNYIKLRAEKQRRVVGRPESTDRFLEDNEVQASDL